MDKLLLLALSCGVVIQVTRSLLIPGPTDDTVNCGNLTCAHKAKCYNDSRGIHCQCHAGFRGITCLDDLDECKAGTPCGHRGVCHNTIGSYWCDCVSGWNGTEHCDVNITEVRECIPGWTGDWCQICSDDETGCGSTSRCSSDGSKCICKAGWIGRDCTHDINECTHDHPCRNSGSCKNSIGSYMCVCPPEWSGKLCEHENKCATIHPCSNSSTCIMANQTYHCLCTDEWQGFNCTEDVDECKNNKCVHVESCSNSIGSYSCNCTDGWQGVNCDVAINRGSSNSSMAGIIAGSSTGVLLVILAALLALLYKYKRKHKPKVADMKERNDIGNNTFKSQVNGHASKSHQTNT